MNVKYVKNENENELDYAMRLIEIKKEERPDDLDWSDICDLLGLDLNRDSLRKSQDTEFGGLAVYKKMKDRTIEKEPINYQAEIKVQLQELKKERMKLSDERAALNRKLREKAREETLHELVDKCALDFCNKFPMERKEYKIREYDSKKSAILTLSDFHYGLVIEEFNNKYNSDIFIDRLNKLLEKTIEYINLNGVNDLYILGLGDYLSGVIHTTTRIENKENIVQQVINVAESLARFIFELSEYCNIFYYDVSDNHGRVFSNKEDSLRDENFSLFVKWFLKARFEYDNKIKIIDDNVNSEIGTLSIYGRNYGFTHGHRDKIGEVVQNLSLMTKQFYDAIFIAHCHHFEANEVHGTYVYMNGTFSGTDAYANNLRRTSNPSQNLFIVNEDEGIECQYLIKL